jgi:hypothetical protein
MPIRLQRAKTKEQHSSCESVRSTLRSLANGQISRFGFYSVSGNHCAGACTSQTMVEPHIAHGRTATRIGPFPAK